VLAVHGGHDQVDAVDLEGDVGAVEQLGQHEPLVVVEVGDVDDLGAVVLRLRHRDRRRWGLLPGQRSATVGATRR
jgi:hypothetical protein